MLRYLYLDADGLQSLHSQLIHKVVIEASESEEDSSTNKLGWSATLKGLLLFKGDVTEGIKQVSSQKFSLTAENLLNEIQASLRARGTLRRDLTEAIANYDKEKEPVWISGRIPLHAIQFCGSGGFESVNRDRAVMFSNQANVDGYVHDDHYFLSEGSKTPQVDMAASLHKFTGLRNGRMGSSSHEAIFFRKIGSSAHPYKIFGSLFGIGDSYQIKPYAISV